MPRKPKMTEEERRAYSAKMRGELEAVMDRAYGAMVATEEFWTTVMRTAATLTDRGPVNSIAIAAQCPHATRVLSSGDWRKAGRFPVKGSTSIRMWTPIRRKSEDAQGATTAPADGGQHEAPSDAVEGWGWRVSGYKAGPVFDISQTDGDAYEPPATAPLAAEIIRDVLASQYRDWYHEDPEQAGGFDFSKEAPTTPSVSCCTATHGDASPRPTPPFPASTPPRSPRPPTVAALILGIAPGSVVMPPLAGIITQDKKPPVHESAVRAIETGRTIADAVTIAAERRRELAVTG